MDSPARQTLDFAIPAFSMSTLNIFAVALPLVVFLILWLLLYFTFWALGRWLRAGAQLIAGPIVNIGIIKRGLAHPRWTRLHPYVPILLVLLVGAVAAVSAGMAFVYLAEQFNLTTSSVYYDDQIVNKWFQAERMPGFTALLRAVTTAASPVGLGILVTMVAAVLFFRKHRASAAFIAVSAGGGALLNLGLKTLFARARPAAASAIAAATGYSFPSGHAMGSFIVFGSIAYILMRQPYRWKWKSAWLALLVTAVLLVGLSRVYLGVHWGSDIAAGWSAAAVWLASATVAFETLLRLRELRRGVTPPPPGAIVPDVPVANHDAVAGKL